MSENVKNNPSFRPVVGIDFGTTNSAVAYIHKGKPQIIPGPGGERIIPSVVLIAPNGKLIVGEDARAALIAMPERTKAAVKREMGDKDSIMLAGESYSPEEVSAMILKQMKNSVDQKLGEGEKEAIITVPAYFTDEQRRATKRAGELAGFVVERIINEPTAAALAFGFQHLDEDRHLLVYDLGGGTFDVSIVELMDGILEVKASSGNSRLGGEDFDWLLVDWLSKQMIDQYNVDPRTDIRAKAVLKAEAEKIKIQLSDEELVEISLPIVMMKEEKPLGLYTQITREEFVSLIEPLLRETMDKVKEVLIDAGLEAQEIDDILLVGGSTRIPQIHDLIQYYFNKDPRGDVNPDEAVALGAAIQAGLKSGALSKSGLIVTDVAPFSMGVAVAKGLFGSRLRPGAFQAIIPRNTTIPVTRTETFSTVADYQTEVMVKVYQGENEWVKNNHFLNEFLLEGLPSASAGSESVAITFRYNLNGILEVTAKGVSNEESITVTIQDSLDRSSEEAFQESLKKVEAIQQEQLEEELDLFDFMNDDIDFLEGTQIEDRGNNRSLLELQKEAKDCLNRCHILLENSPIEGQKALKETVNMLDEALKTEDSSQLEEAIDLAMDMIIDLDM
ncbi:Hsp70 family protein [Sporosarcina limicola]|uniref:Chaperone protein DnaK n=1 Tax=Sporosarcina limicola TaxID=34101 RepID=A0A927R881_9BACL|nr:Hsp70 family protein [Sporosarcina limicola]MBE1556739.1 molecular chaperone DnaK [Sporosarcina limicola]